MIRKLERGLLVHEVVVLSQTLTAEQKDFAKGAEERIDTGDAKTIAAATPYRITGSFVNKLQNAGLTVKGATGQMGKSVIKLK